MKLNELRDFLNSLPVEFDEYPVVNGDFYVPDGESDYHYRVDKPIMSLIVDEETQEVVFLHELHEFEEPDSEHLHDHDHDEE